MIKDEPGNKYGHLTVLYDSGLREPTNKVIKWVCLCDCGGLHIVNGNSLRYGGALSCGCSRRIRKKVKL